MRRLGMKKLMMVAAVMALESTTASAATTNAGYPACFKREWLDDLMQFTISKDENSWKAYMKSGKCLMMKAGLKVVSDRPNGSTC